jgi:hypothetical protein
MIVWAIFGVLGIFLICILTKATSGSVADVARQAGFTGTDLLVAVAIAYAESGGNSDAVGDTTLAPKRGPSIGLWQIDIGIHPEYTKEQMVDPLNNARAAYQLYIRAGNSFAPWTTYKSGAYTAFLTQATKEVNA